MKPKEGQKEDKQAHAPQHNYKKGTTTNQNSWTENSWTVLPYGAIYRLEKKSLTLVLERKEDYARTVTSENSLNFHPCYISEKSDDANHKKSGKS